MDDMLSKFSLRFYLPLFRLLFFSVGGGVFLVGCDPCSGVIACQGDALVRGEGRMIDHASGKGIPGVLLHFVRSDGPSLVSDSIVVQTDSEGWFSLQVQSLEEGEVSFRVVVSPSAPYTDFGYTVEEVKIEASSIRGAGRNLGRWLVNPYLALVGELHLRTGGRMPPGGKVRFVRRSGAALAEATLETEVGADGRIFFLFEPEEGGDLLGDIQVQHPSLRQDFWIRDVEIPPSHIDGPIPFHRVFGVGPSLFYAGELRRRSAGKWIPIPNAQVRFQRTGGIQISPSTFSGSTNNLGAFSFPISTQEEGIVQGRLTFTLPSGNNVVYDSVKLQTFDSDELRLLDRWIIGEQIHQAITFYRRKAGGLEPLSNMLVEFRRTGGIQVTPSTLSLRTTEWGGYPIQLETDETGEVRGDLIVHLPPPLTPDTLHDVEFRTRASDEFILAESFVFGPQINYAGSLYFRDSGAPVVDAEVTFRRTGGISISPDTFTVRTVEWGGFPIQAHTDEVGEVEGEFLVRLTPQDPPILISDVHISSFASDEFRFLGAWAID